MFTKNCMVYIKHTENSRPELVTDINIFQDTHMEEFCSVYNFKSLIKYPTSFKNSEKPTTIDHILTNHPKCFQHPAVYETGLSEFHRLTLTVLKVYHSK